ncbi:hypothetical protein CFC21_107099 [Triticum aestivum]|nr:G-type lectin S-receptor-like serine/threonine-protein kinase LECRK2 [Triticum aestivum]XP_045086806.1 G-type lectin S-receptor-like serine/threonine-protein kinase LECRK2 [Aegilops tauschii subsp. strangulata]KAF7106351.1 hypothetical protein CFC21_107091 [Triticum aestivum]KAF7106360.1 hypothetical protein CFC21_107099 [Triticum aestivum]
MQALLPRLALLCLAAQQTGLLPAATARTNLTVRDALAPPRYITSPSGGFAFGFRALDSDPTKFLLATWFRLGKDDEGTSSQPQPESVVWFAKKTTMGDTPIATAKSVLSVTADGHLTLTDGSGQELWRAPTPSMQRGSVLALSDSGNVRFLGGDGDTVLWESFRYPTDTLLPGQPLAPTPGSPLAGYLFSKRADAEFATGRFSLAAQPDGNIVLCIDLFTGHIQHNSYWATNTYGSGDNTTVTLDDRGFLNYTLHNGTVRSLISPAASSFGTHGGDFLQFARMDTDGIVRTYTRPRNGGGNTPWTVSGALPGDGGCTKVTSLRQGLCGPGSYCVETRDRLSCMCPSGYTYVDAQHTDSGCTPELEPHSSCGGENGGSDEFSLVEMPNTTWEISLYHKKYPSVTEEQCRSYCLSHCYCAAALMIDGSDCAEVGALTYGRRADDVTTTTLIKVRKGNTAYTDGPSAAKRKMLRPYKIATLCVSGLVLITISGLVARRYLVSGGDSQRPLSYGVRAFSWKELHQATNGFQKLLGKGSFGEVYKGTIRSPEPHPIAVKKLIDSNEYSEQEFTNEVQSIGQIHHRNLVRMIGYCKEGKHRMLVFEFMPGGSLRGVLFVNQERRPPWCWRAEAALAIARGLEYLHDGCTGPVIHCDIKPDNILLDDHGVPRITDFGISKLLGSQQVHTTVTHIRGTRGYIAPEWLRSEARVDTKADVYSFGVVLLEMICCRRCQERVVHDNLPTGTVDDDETVTLFGWAAQLVVARRTELMLDGDAEVETVEDMERVEQFARVALWCIEPNPQLRPTMHQVVQMLETRNGAQIQALPDPPNCYVESSPLIPQLRIE